MQKAVIHYGKTALSRWRIYDYDTLDILLCHIRSIDRRNMCLDGFANLLRISFCINKSNQRIIISDTPHEFSANALEGHLHFYTNSSVSSLPEPASYRILLFHLSVGVYQVVSCTYHYILIRTSSSDSLIASTHSEHFLVGSRGSCLLFYYSLYIHRSV